jgi:hypothetical protein
MHPLSLSCQKQQIENETEGSHVVRRRELGREEMTARHGSWDGDSQGGERTRDLKTMYNQDNIIYAMQIMDRRPLYTGTVAHVLPSFKTGLVSMRYCCTGNYSTPELLVGGMLNRVSAPVLDTFRTSTEYSPMVRKKNTR